MDIGNESNTRLAASNIQGKLPLVSDICAAYKKILANPVVKTELPMLQLGWPYLEKRRGKLVISFRAHQEALLDDGRLGLYAPVFDLAFVYPFDHAASFRDLTLDAAIDVSSPVCILNEKQIEKDGEYMMYTQKLFDECTRVLQMQAEHLMTSDLTISKYQKLYAETAEALGLTPVYASTTSSGD